MFEFYCRNDVAGKLHSLEPSIFLTGEFGPIRINWDIRVVYPAVVT